MYDRRRFEEAGGIAYKDLCIVEEPHLRKLVIGDAIGSIVMALLNDQKSRKNIDTLDMHLSRFEKGNLNGREERQRRAMANENIREQIDVLTRRLAQMQNNIVDEIDVRLQVEMQEELANNIERIRVLQLNFDGRPPV
jgi:superfamily II RNA helicase